MTKLNSSLGPELHCRHVAGFNVLILCCTGLGFSKASKLVLGLFGFRSEEGGAISEEALRLIVMGASKSGGIEKDEANMVEAVLDLNDTKVSKVMCPRTEVVAIDQVCYWNALLCFKPL